MEAIKFIQKLIKGGAIVSSSQCTKYEISQAKLLDRFFVDEDGIGYVYFPDAIAFSESLLPKKTNQWLGY